MLTSARRPVKHGQDSRVDPAIALQEHHRDPGQPVDDRVTAAIDRVARDRCLRAADGRQLPQTSKPELIATMLRLLDVWPGHRVLEVGTGSGYSTALLAHLVGPHGQVISLDTDPEAVRGWTL